MGSPGSKEEQGAVGPTGIHGEKRVPEAPGIAGLKGPPGRTWDEWY